MSMIKEIIKNFLPQFTHKYLIFMKSKFYDPLIKRKVASRSRRVHEKLLAKSRGKEKIRVVFLEIFDSSWKMDSVFKTMLNDPYFEPIILVCPYTVYGEQRMLVEMKRCLAFFNKQKYPVIESWNAENNKWVNLKELNPDLLFLNNPHKLTRNEYYEDAYLNYLSCYVPYHYEVGQYNNNQSQYNQFFHNAIWKIFAPHKTSIKVYKSTCATKGKNVVLTGYPHAERLLTKNHLQNIASVWKGDKSKIRVIWAPHHTIDSPELPYSNFLKYAEFFKQIAKKFENEVQWCFKPHPILKSKLQNHADWGREKTEEYYEFWKNQSYSQLNEGDYVDLFCESTAMIHDSGSFLAEYLHVNKPVLYLVNTDNYMDFYNDFGKKALDCCDLGKSENDILIFIENLKHITNLTEKNIESENLAFFQSECPDNPTDEIINVLKKELKYAN